MNKQTKATSIPPAVKKAVWERDNKHCIICGSPEAAPVAHYIRRSQGGKGIEENIVTLCAACHREADEGPRHVALMGFIRGYLKTKYPGWNEDLLKFSRNL